jgi:hypothetical protein
MDRLRTAVAYRQFVEPVERPNPAPAPVSDRRAPEPVANVPPPRGEAARSWQGPPDEADAREVFVIQPRAQSGAAEPPVEESLMRRYGPPSGPAPGARAQAEPPSPRMLSEIFARLEAKAR